MFLSYGGTIIYLHNPFVGHLSCFSVVFSPTIVNFSAMNGLINKFCVDIIFPKKKFLDI